MAKLIIAMLLFILSTLLKAEEESKWIGLREDGLCQGNRFLFLSTYILGRQQDLTLTFQDINQTAQIDEVIYSDELYRTYRIFNLTQNITYLEGKQTAELLGQNILRVGNGTVRVNFIFAWQKTQLGTSITGTGTGTVLSDKLTYQKTLYTNMSHELQWKLSKSQPVAMTTGPSLRTMEPYKKADYEILSNMLNKLSTGQATIKDNFLKVINRNLESILSQKVMQDPTLQFEKVIYYSYTDYRGEFALQYSQTLMNSTLAEDGLYLLFSQVIQGYKDFECGEPVPQIPDDPVFGGLQEFLSNSLIKSTLRYALKNGSLDVILKQESWQSQAFQFFMGDIHEVMPTATKALATMTEITGRCDGLDDPVFSFTTKTNSAYEVKVNFQCYLNHTNTSKLVSIDIVVNYQVTPKLNGKYLDFSISKITGAPAYIESGDFHIEYKELADFMVTQTMALAKIGNVIGSGYKAMPRKFGNLWVKQNYLFLYDASVKPKGIFWEDKEEKEERRWREEKEQAEEKVEKEERDFKE